MMSAGIFRPIVPNQAVATLLLVENSQNMATVWTDLRDHYLRPLVHRLESTSPPTPTTMFVLPSMPPAGEPNLIAAVPQQSAGLVDGLKDFRFNYAPHNKLSAAKICSGIDFLASTKFQGQAVARHIVIVAASTPAEDMDSLEAGCQPHGSRSVWQLLAAKLMMADIHCHMVLVPTANTSPLIMMFDEALRLQNDVEVLPWFPTNPEKFIVRLSSRARHQQSSDATAPYNHPLPLRRNTPPLQRNYSFPPDTYSGMAGNEPPQMASKSNTSPSLVSQLQQVHGLTKKKVYGAKPVRQPFFREEPVREKYRRAPTPLLMPASPPSLVPLSTPDGRNATRPRADRVVRYGPASPTDPQSRLQGRSSRRGSRLSSPEGDGLPSPTSLSSLNEMSSATGYFSSAVSSPVSPTTVIDDVYHSQPRIPAQGSVTMLTEGGVVPEPAWLQQQRQHARDLPPYTEPSVYPIPAQDQLYYPVVTPITPPTYTYGPLVSPSIPPPSVDIPLVTVPTQTNSDLDNVSTLSPLSLIHSQVPQPSAIPVAKTTTPASIIPPLSPLSSLPALSPVDGDQPFIFDSEFTLPSAARPKPASNNEQSQCIQTTSSSTSPVAPVSTTLSNSSVSPSPATTNSADVHSQYVDFNDYFQFPSRQPVIKDVSLTIPHVPPLPTTTTSSLTGWAG